MPEPFPRQKVIQQPAPPHCYCHDPADGARDLPQSLLLPFSLQPAAPGRQVLFRHQRVLTASRVPPVPERKSFGSNITSTMSLMTKRWRDRCRDTKHRFSPASFRSAGVLFALFVLFAIGAVVVGWVGAACRTWPSGNHNGTDSSSNSTVATSPSSLNEIGPVPVMTTDGASTVNGTELEEAKIMSEIKRFFTAPGPPKSTQALTPETVTTVYTVTRSIVTVTTDFETKTLATTEIHTTTVYSLALTTTPATRSVPSDAAPTDGDAMTGTMYCPFSGRPNIYTLCPLVHTNQPGMLNATGGPHMASAATPRLKNPFTSARLALVSLWNSAPSIAWSIPRGKLQDGACDHGALRAKLDRALDVVRLQQEMLDSQHAIIAEHREALAAAMGMLAKGRTRQTPLNAKL
ncbi:hypothetical protein F4780DRAFT_751893 [Xylariomycetidae sp. FL0641]|nr:hypothetical protein F4780DRAFT_751893 [Xylariomycetidae sp. FL0641]